MSVPCRWCGATDPAPRFFARERMFGGGESFAYLECARCGSLSIERVPTDLAKHYPASYYSFATPTQEPHSENARAVRRLVLSLALATRRVITGRPLLRTGIAPPPWLVAAGIAPTSPILDIGCGAGHLVMSMYNWGFTDLTGIDPFRASDATPAPGVALLARDATAHDGAYALVMLHHTLEHAPDPQALLAEARRLVAPGGAVVVRIPLARSAAWDEYGVDWIQLDPPRHLHVPTESAFVAKAGSLGLVLERSAHDSTAFQHWGSEQWRRGMPLADPRSYAVAPRRSTFSASEIAAFDRRANEANRAMRGDQGWFLLRRV